MLRVPASVPARPLAVFRIVVGLVAALKGLEFVPKTLFYANPTPLYSFLPDLPRVVWAMLALPMIASSVMLVVGFKTRLAALVTGFLTLAFLFGAYNYYHHIYMIGTVAIMLALTDSDAALSLRSHRGLGQERVWGPPVYLLRATISIVYIYAAIAKMNFDFLSGNELALLGFESMIVPDSFRVMPLLVALAVGAILSELVVGIGLWVPRLRRFAVTVGVLLHFGMIAYISPVFVAVVDLTLFAAVMITGYGLFFDRLPGFLVRPISGAWWWITSAGWGATRHARPTAASDARVADKV
jgi:uncharacterized membrane protein YphA (DoxX/SURF4 family)